MNFDKESKPREICWFFSWDGAGGGGGGGGSEVGIWKECNAAVDTLRELGCCITNYCFNVMELTKKLQTGDIKHC